MTGFRAGTAPADEIAVSIAGHIYKASPQPGPARVWEDVLFADGQAWPFSAPRFEGGGETRAGDGALTAPMPGTVTALNVKQGDTVKRGEVLLVLEAMKMENGLKAPFDGTVAELKVTLGAQVVEGAVLARIEKAPGEAGKKE